MLSPSIEALTMGNCCSVMMTARAKKGMKVRRAPWRFSKADLVLLRRCTIRVRSTSYMQWTWALVRRDSIMRWAMILRMLVMGTRSPGYGAGAGGAAVRGGAAEDAGAWGEGVAGPLGADDCRSMKDMMSCFEMRPPSPVPEIWERLMPC